MAEATATVELTEVGELADKFDDAITLFSTQIAKVRPQFGA